MMKIKKYVITTALFLSVNLSLYGCASDSDNVEPQKENLTLEAELSVEAEENKPEVLEETVEATLETDTNLVDIPAEETASVSKVELSPLRGTIVSLDASSFVIEKINVEQLEDGSSVALYSSSSEKITISYTENTRFILRTVVNGGVNPSDVSDMDTDASQLTVDGNVILTGNMTDSGFEAEEIVIYHFVH